MENLSSVLFSNYLSQKNTKTQPIPTYCIITLNESLLHREISNFVFTSIFTSINYL